MKRNRSGKRQSNGANTQQYQSHAENLRLGYSFRMSHETTHQHINGSVGERFTMHICFKIVFFNE